MDKEKRTLFLDYGGLICDYNFNEGTLQRAHGLALSRINLDKQRFSAKQISQAHDTAIKDYLEARQKDNSEWTMEKIMGLMIEDLGAGVPVSDIAEIYKLNDHDSTPMPNSIKALEHLSRLGNLGIISNLPHDSLVYELKVYGILDMFDPIVISYQVGFRKPRPEIYKEGLKRVGINAEEGIFISHDADEVEGAEKVGMRGVLVKSLEEVIGKL